MKKNVYILMFYLNFIYVPITYLLDSECSKKCIGLNVMHGIV